MNYKIVKRLCGVSFLWLNVYQTAQLIVNIKIHSRLIKAKIISLNFYSTSGSLTPKSVALDLTDLNSFLERVEIYFLI